MRVIDSISISGSLLFLRSMPERLARYIGADRPDDVREAELARSLARATHRVFVLDGDEARALAWIVRDFTGPVGTIHFAANDAAKAPAAARILLHHAKSLGYASLAGFVPAPFRHIRNFAKALGFVEACRINSAFSLPAWDRPHDGVLLIWNAPKT